MRRLEQKILDLLASRGLGLTICPSEVLDVSKKSDATAMNGVRAAAKYLVSLNLIEIVQRGRIVDPDTIRGPIRLRLKAPD